MRAGGVLRHLIVGWVRGARRYALLALALSVLVAACAIYYGAPHLGVSTDTAALFSPDLSWRKDYLTYQKAFPQDIDNLIVVIDAATPELASSASRTLAEAIAHESTLFESARVPGDNEFLQRNALLYLEPAELEALVEKLAQMQPILGALRQDPTLSGFAALLARAAEARAGGGDVDLVPILRAIADAAQASAAGRFYRVSWQDLLDGDASSPRERRAFVMVRPHLDWSQLFPAEAALARIRAIAQEQGLVPEQGVRVRITGIIAMEHEELDTVMRGAGRAGVLALVMVVVVLAVGLGSIRLMAVTLLTLLLGLAWTVGFAALAVGHLNVISVAFAVLYIGLGTDYAVHFCLRYRELVDEGLTSARALDATAGDVGMSLLVCAFTTGTGFYAFLPTDFLGVSELGLIAGTGMFLSLAATLTVLPALLALMPLAPRRAGARRTSALPASLAGFPYRRRRAVLGGALVLGLGACALLPFTRFDGNPVNLRDPAREAVSTFLELVRDADPTPLPYIVLVPDAQAAAHLAGRLRALDPVSEVRTLEDFVPDDQAEKLALIEQLGLMLGFQSPAAAPEEGAGERRAALERLAGTLDTLSVDGSLAEAAGRAGRALSALAGAAAGSGGAAVLSRFEAALLGTLSEQIRRLDRALEAESFTVAELPESIKREWIAPDGARRVEVYTKADLQQPKLMEQFLSAVRSIAPRGTGDAVVFVESGRAIVRAFQEAFALALVIIAVLLWLLLGRIRYVAEVIGTLLFAAAVTVAFMVIIGMPFNYANVIALPLLLGVGVDNGIHMVHRMRAAPPRDGNLLATSTTRATIVSGLTTVCGFGNLAFVSHPGTASMGLVLSVGLFVSLIAALVVLPALLAGERRQAAFTASESS